MLSKPSARNMIALNEPGPAQMLTVPWREQCFYGTRYVTKRLVEKIYRYTQVNRLLSDTDHASAEVEGLLRV
jgi:hypothetical protein